MAIKAKLPYLGDEVRLSFQHHVKPGTVSACLDNVPYHPRSRPKAVTVCRIHFDSRGFAKVGHAFCYPADNFCRETGRKVALTRAVASLNMRDRRAVWQAYLERAQ